MIQTIFSYHIQYLAQYYQQKNKIPGLSPALIFFEIPFRTAQFEKPCEKVMNYSNMHKYIINLIFVLT